MGNPHKELFLQRQNRTARILWRRQSLATTWKIKQMAYGIRRRADLNSFLQNSVNGHLLQIKGSQLHSVKGWHVLLKQTFRKFGGVSVNLMHYNPSKYCHADGGGISETTKIEISRLLSLSLIAQNIWLEMTGPRKVWIAFKMRPTEYFIEHSLFKLSNTFASPFYLQKKIIQWKLPL